MMSGHAAVGGVRRMRSIPVSSTGPAAPVPWAIQRMKMNGPFEACSATSSRRSGISRSTSAIRSV